MNYIAYPRQVILLTSSETVDILGKETEKDNIMAVSWHMPVSSDPEMYAVSISKESFSYKLIEKSKVFTINFMPYSLSEEILFCGENSGKHMDKFKESGLTKEECEKIHCVRIKEALAHIECEVVEMVEVGDYVIIIGKVVGSNINRQDKRPFQAKGEGFTTTKD